MRRLACLLALALAASAARAERFVVAPGDEQNVKFESKAPVETFGGKTKQVEGAIDLDPAQLGDSLAAEIRVDLRALDTGIALRNRHMCENHLECAKYPTATFTGGRIAKASATALAPGHQVTFDLVGTLDLHGVRKPMTVPVEVMLEEASGARLLRVATRFQVKLRDHGIARPKMLVMKLDEVQRLDIALVARTRKE